MSSYVSYCLSLCLFASLRLPALSIFEGLDGGCREGLWVAARGHDARERRGDAFGPDGRGDHHEAVDHGFEHLTKRRSLFSFWISQKSIRICIELIDLN